ncbi:Adenylate cyclase type 10 [Phlyctochytrium planicorne]|nr:Adenylate cyclase type 10 [Phlyctochytrium planicorne]
MRIESLLARRLRLKALPTVPSVEPEKFACVAVIDISGYTQLTNELAALRGIDRIRDVLNPPFEIIISTVDRWFGSVVKLAGDSAIVAWTASSQFGSGSRQDERSEEKWKHTLCSYAILCCIELLQKFENYSIKVGQVQNHTNAAGGDEEEAGLTPNSQKDASRQKRASYSGSAKTSDQSRRASMAFPIETTRFQKLGLHIGLGFGEMHHIFVGSFPDSSHDVTKPKNGRAEYFIAGKALLDAGIMLNKGKSGDLVFLKDGLENLAYWSELRRYLDSSNETVFVSSAKADLLELNLAMSKTLKESDEAESWTENQFHDSFKSDPRFLSFLEPSLTRHLISTPAGPIGSITLPSTTSSLSENINQFRTITCLFLCLPNIPVEKLGNSAVFQDVNFVAMEVIKAVNTHGGTCRQMHADEKSLSALLVWGVEGYSHEKGDHNYAISAGLDILGSLRNRKWWFDREESDVEPEASRFSLAITMGKAFCGVIGTETRSEGTVLGPCVNLAARIMCNPQCRNRLLCDEVIAEASGKSVEFAEIGTMSAKGFVGKIKLFEPTRVAGDVSKAEGFQEETELLGRDQEFEILASAVDGWKAGERFSCLVVGESGLGKSELVKSFLRSYQTSPDYIFCFGSARENRNDSQYVYQQILLSLCRQLIAKGWNGRKIGQLKKKSTSSLGSKRSEGDMGSLIASKDIFDKGGDHETIEVFLSLGLSRNGIRQLQQDYPLLFPDCQKAKNDDDEVGNRSDSVTILTSAIFTILEMLPVFRQRLVLFIDDAQWMDSGSFETTVNVIQRFTHVFVIMTSRPKEEYSQKFRPYFDQIQSLPSCKYLHIQKFGNDAVEKLVVREMRAHGFDVVSVGGKLLADFTEKSQGNPMVIKLLCKYLSNSPDIVAKGKILQQVHDIAHGADKFELPLNASAAVVSTLDKMPSDAQTVLRVASVAGQFFSLEEVLFCLKKLKSNEKLDNIDSFVIQMLSLAQSHGLVNPTDPNSNSTRCDFSFHHYLIYQGIYESNIQSRKEELHHLYAEFYEAEYEHTANFASLPPLLHHLGKLQGMLERKKKFFRIAFKVFADWGRPIEAKGCFEVLRGLDGWKDEEMVPVQRAQEERLLGIIEADLRNYQIALDHYLIALSIMGCNLIPYGQSNFKVILKLLKYSSKINSMLGKPGNTRFEMGLKSLSTILPQVLSTKDVQHLIHGKNSSCVVGEWKLVDVLVEIRSLILACLVLILNYRKPGLEAAFFALVYHIVQECLCHVTAKKDALAPTSVGAAIVFLALRRVNGARVLFEQGLGNFGAVVKDVQATLDGKYADLKELVEWADMQMCLAYNYVAMGRLVEAFRIHEMHSMALEEKIVEKLPEWRVVFFGVMRCHVEVAMLSSMQVADDSGSRNRIMLSALSTIKCVSGALKRQRTQQRPQCGAEDWEDEKGS